MKAITHIHTEYSWDSMLRIDRLIEELIEHEIELAVVTDHDTFNGSIALRRRLDDLGLAIRVPVSAEVRTDRGDVVVIFEDEAQLPDVDLLRSSKDLKAIVDDHGGLLWLPHPYRGHPELGDLPGQADVIEVFNARCSPKKNARALDLCLAVGAVPAFGADVHLKNEVGAVVVEYLGGEDTLDILRTAPRCDSPIRTRKSNVMAAEIINGVKVRRPLLVGYFAVQFVKQRVLELARGFGADGS
jgi:predicted metal-dependent phosphoesterase TrpH